MYHPNLGRWMTEDPILLEGGDPNYYRFVGNNPTNATDPSGLQEVPIKIKTRKVKMPDGTVKDEPYPVSEEPRCKQGVNALAGNTKKYCVVLITDDTTDTDPAGWMKDEPNAKIYCRVRNLNDAIQILNGDSYWNGSGFAGKYDDGSICRLIISGHNRATGCGASVSISRFPYFTNKDDTTVLSYRTITGKKAHAISRKLSPDAVVIIASCHAGDDPRKMQILADNLRRPVQASDGDCMLGYGTSGMYRQVNPVGVKPKP
ncbi:MAG TPA: RHS repeat-associated core domain-containing protein [Fimbriiglobus sp.]|nr:RHS repeat-associated core domain-containing protein [Fimbriiglobus sp.]